MINKNKKERKASLIIIIILLVIFLPLSVFSVYLKANGKDKPKPKENILKEFAFDNKLWFYDNVGNLIGTYECENIDGLCTFATIDMINNNYHTDIYKYDETSLIGLINNRYAFLKDVSDESITDIFLYDAVNNFSYKSATYLSAQNYQVGIEGNLFIVQNADGLYGVLDLSGTPKMVLPFEYDYIALPNSKTTSGEIKSDKFIAYKEGKWYIVEKNNNPFLTSDVEITSFTNDTMIIIDAYNQYKLVDYEQNELLEPDSYVLMTYLNEQYVNVYRYESYFIYDIVNQTVVSKEYSYGPEEEYTAELNNAGDITIMLNGNIIETLDLP